MMYSHTYLDIVKVFWEPSPGSAGSVFLRVLTKNLVTFPVYSLLSLSLGWWRGPTYAYSCILYPERSHAFPIAPSPVLWQFVSPVTDLPANLTQIEQGFLAPSSLSPSSGQLLTLLACLLCWLIFFQVTIKLYPNFKQIKQGPLWAQRMKAWVRLGIGCLTVITY